MAEDTLHFFKRNVGYSVVVRDFIGDKDGVVLNAGRTVYEVPEKNLKMFRDANKKAIREGLVIEIEEPVVIWDSANALSDEDADELLKNYLKLKSSLTTLDSLPILYKLQDIAKAKDLSKKTLSLIQARIDEVKPDDDVIMRPGEA